MYNFRVEVLRSLIAQGKQVYVLAPRDNYSAKLISEGVHYIPLEIDNYGMNPLRDLKLLWTLFRTYRTYRFDKIYHYTIKPNIYGSIAAYLAKIHTHVAVVTGLGKMFRFKSPLTSFLANNLFKVACRINSQTWFLNIHDQQKFIQEGICPKHKSLVLPSEGINISKFRPGKKTQTPLIRFLFAGRLLKQKGIELYLQAAKIFKLTYPNVRFEVLGFIDENNPDAITYKEIGQWHQQGFIKYLGSTEDVRPYIQRADCIVFPSFYQEGLSRILLESASMATPIITSDQVGCREVVINRVTGYLCKKKSLASLVTCIETFLSLSPRDREIMGAAARQRVKERYDMELVKVYYLDKNPSSVIS